MIIDDEVDRNNEGLTFDEWKFKVRELNKQADYKYFKFWNDEDWQHFFNDDLSPEEALKEYSGEIE